MKTTKLKIRVDGDPCLSRKSDPVEDIGVGERLFIESMIVTMYEDNGVGLAAPQVGINKRMFVVDIGDGPVVIINPQILSQEGLCTMEEGCLSVPSIEINIERSQKIKVSFLTENNQLVNAEYEDLMARVFLHEYDHLEGKTILDYASEEELSKFEDQLKKIHDNK